MLRTSSLLGFVLAAALPLSGQLVWQDLGGGRMELREDGRPVLVYNYGPQWREPAPENRRRCCYIFPLFTPAGVSMLEDFPPDHWHHRGVFWTWPVVETEGNTYDLWMDMSARHRSTRLPQTSVDSGNARLLAENYWVAGGKDIVRENLNLTVLPATAASREFEIALTWEALANPVTVRGSQEDGKSYGGLCARFADRQGTVLRADGEVIAKDEDLNPHGWAELEAVYGGKRVALRITPDGSNPGVPYQWCLRNYGFVGASFPGRTAEVDGYTLKPGEPLTLKFRVSVTDLE